MCRSHAQVSITHVLGEGPLAGLRPRMMREGNPVTSPRSQNGGRGLARPLAYLPIAQRGGVARTTAADVPRVRRRDA